MSSLLEKSLDEIIGSGSGRPERSRKLSGNRGRNSRVSKPGRRGPPPARNFRGRAHNGSPNEIKISNLHPELTNEDLTQLMETVGPTTRVEIKYNTHGKSIGVAYVEYEFGRDAMEAIKRFDGRLAAGQIIGVSSTMPLIDRIGGRAEPRSRRRNPKPAVEGDGNGNAKAGGNPKPKRKERKTLEDLDNELNMYMNGEAGEVQSEGQPVAEHDVPQQDAESAHTAVLVPAQEPIQEPIQEPTQEAAHMPAQESTPIQNGVGPVSNDVAME